MSQTLDAGTVFGSYAIEGFIAGGGMGEVYAARHAVYGTVVAMKVLHADLHRDADWRRRFDIEGLVGTQLKHPHLLSARELVEHEGRVALVIDLIRGGQTLLKVVTREYATGVPLVAALQVFLGILQGVEYAHVKGIVHGDIKPENVLVSGDFRDAATWLPMVTDFGTVALIAHPVLIDGQAAVVASPRYACPEHMLGVDHLVPRSDIYALGLLLHFLVTGRHVSDARTVQEAANRVNLPIPRDLLREQPAAVVELITRACAVRPEDRYASCRDYALAVRRCLDAMGVKLELEDLQSELATEVMEEREVPPPAAPTFPSGNTSSQPTEPAPPLLSQPTVEEPSMKPPQAPSTPPNPPEDTPRNPLWGSFPLDEGTDENEPTARLNPGELAAIVRRETNPDPTVRLRPGERPGERDASVDRSAASSPAGSGAPSPVKAPPKTHVVTIPEFAPPPSASPPAPADVLDEPTAEHGVRPSQINTVPHEDAAKIARAVTHVDADAGIPPIVWIGGAAGVFVLLASVAYVWMG